MPTVKKALEELPSTLKTIKQALPQAVFSGFPELHATQGRKLRITFTADWHTDADPFRERTDILRKALAGLAKYEKTEVLVMAGDITNSAHEKEYRLLKRLISVYNNSLQLLPQMGNHDARGTSIYPYFYEAEKLFLDFCKFCGIKTQKTYYCTAVNGYYFIVLGTEGLLKDNAILSDEQLSWLKRVLSVAYASGKPCFVINHQPLNGVNGANDEQAGVGAQSEQLKEILLQYAEKGLSILYVSGHIHKMGEKTLETLHEHLYCLNLPSFEYHNGAGFRCEVYDGYLELSGVDFIKNVYFPEHKYVLPFTNKHESCSVYPTQKIKENQP